METKENVPRAFINDFGRISNLQDVTLDEFTTRLERVVDQGLNIGFNAKQLKAMTLKELAREVEIKQALEKT